jgi:peptidoglycan hydrolase-like protein with peptidoglycan-binding domain
MGGAPWGDGICPGPVRAGQRLSIIAAAQMLRHPYNPHPYPGPYQIGSVGIVVKQIQCRLNKYGYRLKIDGIFGERTEVAVIGFQKYHGLVGDGIVGPLTWKRLWV